MIGKYHPKIKLFIVILDFVFISCTFLTIHITRNEIDTWLWFPIFFIQCITFMFTAFSLKPETFVIRDRMFMINFYNKKYIIQDYILIIITRFKRYEIDYKEIINIRRMKVKPFWKYGFIRGKNDLDVLMITTLNNNKKIRMMISPKNMELFIEEIHKKCLNVI